MIPHTHPHTGDCSHACCLKIEHLNVKFGAEAALEQLALYPEAIANETSRGFALPAAGKEFRTFVVGFPDKLLPRNFTGIPFALQAVDAAATADWLEA